MATRITTKKFKAETATDFVQSVANDEVFIFIGEHAPRANATVPDMSDTVGDTVTDLYRNLIAAKKATSNDAVRMIRKVEYEINKVYDMYDDRDDDLFDQDFFVIVDEGSYSHVWKCLDNNNGAKSTVAPAFEDLNVDDEVYQSADGYRWKYMCSVTSSQVTKHETGTYFPIIANTIVSDNAVDGAIDVIKIENAGEGYDNYLTGTFAADDIRVNGNTTIYGIDSNNQASSVNGFYTGCLLYISSGSGSGQYRNISDSFSNANGKFVVIESEFSSLPAAASEFEIYPSVRIVGDGSETSNAVARALVNSIGNSIYRVEMLSRGAGYQTATAEVLADATVDVAESAKVRPIMGPAGGHGYDAYSELGATRVSVAVRFSNTESNTIPATGQYQQVGIMRDPVFQNVIFNFASSNGTFTSGEKVSVFTSRLIVNGGTTVEGNATLTVADGKLDERLVEGDWIYLKDGDGTQHQLTQVDSITNSSSLEMTDTALWSCSSVIVSLATIGPNAIVNQVLGVNNVGVTSLDGAVNTGDAIIGHESGAYGVVDTISRAGVLKGFNTFVGMQKIEATVDSGTFDANEKVYQGDSLANSTSNAYLHSATVNGGDVVLYLTQVNGTFDASQIKGANSGATANIVNKYHSEIEYGSGEILTVENVVAVTRQADQSENINIIVEF